MANNKTADLTIKIGGIPVKGRVQTDLDTGNSKWSPYATGVGGIQVVTNLDTIYLESKRKPDGTYSPWESKGSIDVFQNLADNNPQIKSAYSGDRQKVLTAFYSTTTSTDTLNSGRLNQFNTNGAPQTAKTLGIPGAVNTASSGTGTGTGTGSAGTPVAPPATSEEISTTEIDDSSISKKIDDSLKVNLVYPSAMRKTGQDRIKFTALQIGPREGLDVNIKTAGIGKFSLGKRTKTALGSVTLPIQPTISDSSGVDWSGANLDPITAYAASKSLGIAAAGGNIAGEVARALNEAAEDFKDIQGISKAMQIYFAQQAVGAQGLLSRTSGAVLNPNLELLFNGPTLRPFNFTFRLSPRDSAEATEVKAIINWFKKAMAVKTASSEVFLKTPNIFQIKYHSGTDTAEHKSLNRIKDCALLGCDVDYTPDGSYMTFNDEKRTMTSYQLTLRFSELDPIYNKDYEGLDDQIGY